MGKRLNLKKFRVGLDMTQTEFASKMGFKRTHYQNIENGAKNGTLKFWQSLQKTYNIPATKMWDLMQADEEGKSYGKTRV